MRLPPYILFSLVLIWLPALVLLAAWGRQLLRLSRASHASVPPAEFQQRADRERSLRVQAATMTSMAAALTLFAVWSGRS